MENLYSKILSHSEEQLELISLITKFDIETVESIIIAFKCSEAISEENKIEEAVKITQLYTLVGQYLDTLNQ